MVRFEFTVNDVDAMNIVEVLRDKARSSKEAGLKQQADYFNDLTDVVCKSSRQVIA